MLAAGVTLIAVSAGGVVAYLAVPIVAIFVVGAVVQTVALVRAKRRGEFR
jgi:hypothetical protein